MPKSNQGISGERYMLIPRALIFVTRADKVLLIKGTPTKRLWAGKYNGVGGHVERGEDVLSAARRELLEETGLICNLQLVGTVAVDIDENIGVGLFVFTGECPDGEPRPSAEGTLEWLAASELASLPIVEDVAVLLGKILARGESDPPFAARSSYDENGKLKVVFGK